MASGNDTIYLFGGYTEDYSAQSTVVKVEISGDDEFSFSTVAPMGIVSFFLLVMLIHPRIFACIFASMKSRAEYTLKP